MTNPSSCGNRCHWVLDPVFSCYPSSVGLTNLDREKKRVIILDLFNKGCGLIVAVNGLDSDSYDLRLIL